MTGRPDRETEKKLPGALKKWCTKNREWLPLFPETVIPLEILSPRTPGNGKRLAALKICSTKNPGNRVLQLKIFATKKSMKNPYGNKKLWNSKNQGAAGERNG